MPVHLRETGEKSLWVIRIRRGAIIIIGTLAILTFIGLLSPWSSQSIALPAYEQPPVIAPQIDQYLNSSQFLTEEYRNLSAEWLGGAVRTPTETYDDLSVDPKQDPRLEIFNQFHNYLHEKFPQTSKYSETLNTYGLLYTLPGTNAGLKPIVLLAHQDVVPVNPSTIDQWEHPPYSGYFDGEYVWGRGSSDTKSLLVGILEATDNLLQQNWKPSRTVIIAFGFDEEVGGERGAKSLAEEIERRYGSNSVHFLLDEGKGLSYESGALYALPAVAERGNTGITLVLETPGGHSSVPPHHTGIGIAAEVITRLENIDLFKPSLNEDHPLVKQLAVQAVYSPELDEKTRQKWARLTYDEKARQALADELEKDIALRAYVATTQAIDVIHGGVKVNALPEKVEVKTNYRIKLDSSAAAVHERYLEIAESVARKHDLGLSKGNQSIIPATSNGLISIIVSNAIEPVKSSPTSGPVWDLIGGVTRHIYEEVLKKGPLYFAPSITTGNTDTRHYLGLTNNVYRYIPGIQNVSNAHTVNEHISIDSHIAVVLWYYELLQVLE